MLSALQIYLKPSDYAYRLQVVLSLFALSLLFFSYLPLPIKGICALSILSAFFYNQVKPHLPFASLVYDGQQWLLKTEDDEITAYVRLRIRYANGLFFIIRLEHLHASHTLVIFADQISTETYRALRLLDNK